MGPKSFEINSHLPLTYMKFVKPEIFTFGKQFKCKREIQPEMDLPPVDLYLISEKSIWKNQVQRTGFLLPV